MLPNVCDLVRRDHHDLDVALVAMMDPANDASELRALLDAFRLALAVHVAAEAKVFAALLDNAELEPVFRPAAERARADHRAQHEAAAVLGSTRPGSTAWYARVLQLRVLVTDHADRAAVLDGSLQDLVALPAHRALAGQYATERLRAFAKTSPIALARAELAAS